MKYRIAPSRQRGFSLVEGAIALLILGLLAGLLLAYGKNTLQTQTTLIERDLMSRAEDALTGYVQANFRLPCPAANNNGQEDCASNAPIGLLPWRTLGIADSRAGRIRYGLYRKAHDDAWKDADLGTLRDRFQALVATVESPPTAALTTLGNSNSLDFCTALNRATTTATDSSLLHTVETAADGSPLDASRHNLAFALALPGALDTDGDGDAYDGQQHSQSKTNPVFDVPNRPRSHNYDDEVRTMSFDGLFGLLSCAQALAAVDHAHVNAATSAAIMQQAMLDYDEQMRLADDIAGAAVASATAGVFSAYAGLANSIAVSATAVADAIVTYGATSGIIAAGVAAVITNTAAVATAIATLAAASVQKDLSAGYIAKSQALSERAGDLFTDITKNAEDADKTGL